MKKLDSKNKIDELSNSSLESDIDSDFDEKEELKKLYQSLL